MTRSIRAIIVLLVWLASTAWPAQAQPTWDEEFAGPFASWANAKTTYGAAGDGVTDDTAALQAALTDLGTSGHASVLFLPAGTYVVSGTLTLSARIHVSVIGADPATTILRWTGAAGGSLLTVSGVAYSRINRLTFDGRSTADVLVDQSWTCGSNYFDTGNEYADDVFRDGGTGLRGGNNNCGFAETSVWRSQFLRLTTAGIALKNFNALDLWVWYSKFDTCAVGVTNYPGAGNFHVYNSVFRSSTVSDIFIRNTGAFNIRNNTSIGSAAFFSTTAAFGYPAQITLQGNAISTTSATPIFIGDQGPAMIVDNTIVSSRAATPISVGFTNANGPDGDALIVGNRTASNVAYVVRGRSFLLDNTVSARLSVTEPALPGAPRNRNRSVFEVPVGAAAVVIQQAIDSAVQAGSRAVVHVPAGAYDIAATLVVPANADIQVVGDGQNSAFRWTGTGRGPVLRVLGPTHTVLRDFSVDGSGVADAVALTTGDQSGSRLFLNQVQLGGGRLANLLVSGVDRLAVDARDIGHGPSDGASVTVVGGPLAAAGLASTAKVNIFSGASCCNGGSAYSLSSGGKLLVRDIWYEASSNAVAWARLTGRGQFTLAGARAAVPASVPAFTFNGFTGRAALLTTNVDGRIDISGTTTGALIFANGLLVPSGLSPILSDTSVSGHTVVLQHLRMQVAGGSSVPVPDSGGATSTIVRSALAQTRAEQPQVIGRLPNGQTDLRLYRVASTNTIVGVRVTP